MSSEKQPRGFAADFSRRIAAVPRTRWIRFALVSVIFLLWVVWLGNAWVGLAWFLLLDIYITGYIPWTWWKRRKGPVRSVMAWVDAIVYALVLVYFIFAFLGQQYTIPSSSLEKSLLVGDYLWVNKTVYGPRVPQTPLHFPLAQHTMPLLGTKSYIETPQLAYHRLPGQRAVERGDIVVFNYPMGDSVLLTPDPARQDYYTVRARLEAAGAPDAAALIAAHPREYGELAVRPVDRRENYVKRAIGLPGDFLRIAGDTVFINGKAIAEPDNVQYNYIIPVNAPVPLAAWREIGVRDEDHGTAPVNDAYNGMMYYNVPLTSAMKAAVEKWPQVTAPLIRESKSGFYFLGGVFPGTDSYGWTRTDMGEFWIPARGATLRLTLDNLPVYRRAIETYEGNTVDVRDGKILINGAPADTYTFKMDYYWMMGDNRDRSADSRYWGFVPEDHIIGTPVFIVVSLDHDRTLLDGKIRWQRVLRSANPDKEKWN